MTYLKLKQGVNKLFVQKARMFFRRKKFKNKELSIISSNCIGGGIYHDFGWKFCSPTINMFFKPKDYLLFSHNLEKYIKSELQFSSMGYSGKPYPICKLSYEGMDDVEIHFLHYNSFEECVEKWNLRCNRIDFNRLLFLFTDQNGCSDEDIKEFLKLKYPKLIFCGKKFVDSEFCVKIKPNRKEIKNNINPVDNAMHFVGFTGIRRYEKSFNMARFIKKII